MADMLSEGRRSGAGGKKGKKMQMKFKYLVRLVRLSAGNPSRGCRSMSVCSAPTNRETDIIVPSRGNIEI